MMDLWARNCVNKYRIAQKCRQHADEIDPTLHPMLMQSRDLLKRIAYELEQI